MIVTKTVYLIAQSVNEYNFRTDEFEDKVVYTVWPYDEYDGKKAVSSMEVSFECEQLDPIQMRLQDLEGQKKSLEADFQARITEIQRQINECLAIEG